MIYPHEACEDLGTSSAKDACMRPWCADGPGRRAVYEDLTAIDWILEYAKERQRSQTLGYNTSRALVLVKRLIDASQIWLVLLLTGILVGSIAAAINITTDWLGNMKLGFCSHTAEGGRFYLSQNLCCLGFDQVSECVGWLSWSDALSLQSTAIGWLVNYAVFLILSATFAFSATMLVQEYAVFAQHSGIPEIKTVLGGFMMQRFLNFWTLTIKSLGLVLSVGSGMWLGKEGPLVHVACCCANLFVQPFHNIRNNEGATPYFRMREQMLILTARKREVLSAAAASGISVAFGSPIGGVLFSLEQLSYYFPDKTMWQSFVCAMTAAVALQAMDPLRSGKLILHQTKVVLDWHGFEILPYAFLGVIGGIFGGLFIKANMAMARWKKARAWLPGPNFQVLAVALMTALISFPNYYMRMQSYELVSNLFTDCSYILDDEIGLCNTSEGSTRTIVLLLLAAIIGYFLAVVTFGLQIPAGIILPSMAIGALTGRATGIIMEVWIANYPSSLIFSTCKPDIPCVTPSTYAIIGAAAALAGVTRLTVSIVVIMFEFTGALTYVLPIMIAVMVSKWVGDAFSRHGIYESWIHFNNYPFLDNNEEAIIPDVRVSQVMTGLEDLAVLTATGHTIASLQAFINKHRYRGFPVISNYHDAILLGYISRDEISYNLRMALRSNLASPAEAEICIPQPPSTDGRLTFGMRLHMEQTPLTLPAHSSLHLAASFFHKLGIRYLVFAKGGILQGMLTKKDLCHVLNGFNELDSAGNS